MPKQTLTVNGERHTVEAPDEMPVLWVLRDLLGLTGTKYGCGMALCGACTVLADGEAIRSCVTPLSAVADKAIVTIEALSPNGFHHLQRAWRELNVAQCGYCQAGQIMNAAALLEENPNPAPEDIDRVQQGNLCRCGTYPRIREAIGLAARRMASDRGGEA